MSVLEVLHAARTRLTTDPDAFVFTDWARCTCGHIYQAAVGEEGAEFDYGAITSPAHYKNTLYEGALQAIVEANPHLVALDDGPYREAHRVVSRITRYAADGGGAAIDAIPTEADNEQLRVAALTLIDSAITMLEARYEADRLNVLERTGEPALV